MLRDRLDVVHTSRLVHTAFGRLQYLSSSGVVLSGAGRDPVHFALSPPMTSIMQWIMAPTGGVCKENVCRCVLSFALNLIAKIHFSHIFTVFF